MYYFDGDYYINHGNVNQHARTNYDSDDNYDEFMIMKMIVK
jgi:hypothetical protein